MTPAAQGRPMSEAAGEGGLLSFWPLAPDLTLGTGDPLSAVADDRERWIVFAPAQARLHPEFTALVEGQSIYRPDVDIFYADDVALAPTDGWGARLKPALNPALLAAQDYVGAPLIVRGSFLHRLGGLRQEAGTAVLYDLLLRGLAEGGQVERICERLIAYPGARPEPALADRRAALERWLAGRGAPMRILPGLTPGSLRVRRRLEAHPPVTLAIPTRQSLDPDGRPFITGLLDSLTRSTWPMDRLTVLVGDDLADDAIYRGGRWPFELRRLETTRPPGAPFNYAAKMNALWRAAGTEHLVMMNDDLEVRAPDWLEALMTFAMDEDVGGVGARLLYGDGGVQHAGMIGGPFGQFVHAWAHQAPDAPTYQDWALVQRDWSAVTGAVFATRRSALEAVNGFDERFTLEYNDVDLCLRLRLLGYRIVYAPDAELVHYEKASRGARPPRGSETARFLQRWQAAIADDPMGHPGLARDRYALAPASEEDEAD